VKVFRQNIYKHLQQDWNDVLARVVTLWSPRTRAVQTKETDHVTILSPKPTSAASPDSALTETSSRPEQKSGLVESEESADESAADSTDDGVLVTEEELIQLWLPGKIVHLYARRGIYNAVLVPRNFSDLRRILVQGNIFKDHSSMSIFESLQEVYPPPPSLSCPSHRFEPHDKRGVSLLSGCRTTIQNPADVVKIISLGTQHSAERHSNTARGPHTLPLPHLL
jgi:hypothetical protein